MVSDYDIREKNQSPRRFLSSILKWGHSTEALDKQEERMLSGIRSTHHKFYVDIGDCVGVQDKIWTLAINTLSHNTPIVLLHGFGAGIGFWILNLDSFAQNRPVYAIDLLGFGKSSRPKFSKDATEVEDQYIESLERWRRIMRIEKMILVGHSFGGYLSTAYAIKYSERVEHLILGDPWGFSRCPDLKKCSMLESFVIRASGVVSPLAVIRVAGPLGPTILRKSRPDIVEKYENHVEKHDRTIAKYVYHCNTRKITGELAFKNLLVVGAYPKRPMVERFLNNLSFKIPVTIIIANDSWLDNSYVPEIMHGRPQEGCYTHIETIEAGHQLFSDNADEFNRIVLEACRVMKSDVVQPSDATIEEMTEEEEEA